MDRKLVQQRLAVKDSNLRDVPESDQLGRLYSSVCGGDQNDNALC